MQPHAGQRVVHRGAPLEEARAAMIMVHGRNAAPENILEIAATLTAPDMAFLAPAAAGGTWYPHPFISPRERNEPGISSGLFVIESLVRDLLQRGFESRRIALLGFSQGACLSAEFAIRHPRPYGGVFVLSGGLIGEPGTTWNDVPGSLEGTPVFLGCSDVDSHIPAERVIESEKVFERLGAAVTRRLYPGMGHLVIHDEIRFVQGIVEQMLRPRAAGSASPRDR